MSESRVRLIRLKAVDQPAGVEVRWDDKRHFFVDPSKVSLVDSDGVVPISAGVAGGGPKKVEVSKILVEGEWINAILGDSDTINNALSREQLRFRELKGVTA